MPIGFKQYKMFEFRCIIRKDIHDEIKPVNVDKSSRPTKKTVWTFTDTAGVIFPFLHYF